MSGAPGLSLPEAYAACERLARAHYENFPVASVLLPAATRPHIAAIYAFARTADDFADEPGLEPAERLARLDDWATRLRHCTQAPMHPGTDAPMHPGTDAPMHPGTDAPMHPGTDAPMHPGTDALFLALADTISRFDLPVALFDDLLSAFRQDVTTPRYETWTDLLDYCRRSANPVGRLVLRLHGYHDAGLDRASDAVCTALQLVNFWQDLAVDWSRGRLYVPAESWRARNAATADLDAARWTPAWRSALEDCAARTRALFGEGRPVCDGVRGRLRYELRATWLGGSRILDRLEADGFDVFRARPALGGRDALVIGCRTLFWPGA